MNKFFLHFEYFFWKIGCFCFKYWLKNFCCFLNLFTWFLKCFASPLLTILKGLMVKEICSSRLESHSSQKLKKPQKVVRRGDVRHFVIVVVVGIVKLLWFARSRILPMLLDLHTSQVFPLLLSWSWFAQCCKMTVGNYASDFYPQNPQSNHKNPFCQQVVLKGTKEPEIILIPFPWLNRHLSCWNNCYSFEHNKRILNSILKIFLSTHFN